MSRERQPLLFGALGASLLSLALWSSDLLSLASLRFAGVADRQAQERVVENAHHAILGLECRLLLAHLVWGSALGALAVLALGRRLRTRRTALAGAAALALAAHALALLGMAARYPQLFADRFWIPGGLGARLMRVVTHSIGPVPFDALLALLILGLGLGAGLRLAAPLGVRRLAWAAGGLAAAVLAVVPSWTVQGRSVQGSGASRPNVLILASDSLRTERLESAEVMPFTSALVAKGSLFRFAYTPVARTVPSWVSVLTGLEPRQTDVRIMFPPAAPLARLGPTFLSALRDQGYYTFVTSDFAGDMFPRFNGGFDAVDAPVLTVDNLGRSAVLSGHLWSLPLLRLRTLRHLFPEWRNLATLSDPEWLVDQALGLVARAQGRPFAGIVFFSNSHFPFVAPYPDYKRGSGSYAGPYLYHAPPIVQAAPGPEDVEQVRARYDGALHSIDRATRRLSGALRSRSLLDHTVLVFMGDHGEELYEEPGLFGHGDVLGMEHSQVTPLLLVGPNVPAGRISNAQVRLYDIGATILGLLAPSPGAARRFGEGVSLFDENVDRPLCVETGEWFWPNLPQALRGRRLEYAPISQLLEVFPGTREMGVKTDQVPMVESAKERGVVLGRRYWHEQPTPGGRRAELGEIARVDPRSTETDLPRLFETRCVAGDPHLRRWYDVVAYKTGAP